MPTYGGWTEVREYRVWSAEDVYACVTVNKHRNGWFHVYEDGSEDNELKTRSESYAFRYALDRMHILETEACNACPCVDWDADDRERCEMASENVYDAPHGVRSHVYDSLTGDEIEPWNL